MRKTSAGGARFFSAIMTFCSFVLYPVLVIAIPAAIVLRRSTRCYMSSDRDATLAVTAKHNTWSVADHSTAKPGEGRGRALRQAIAPALMSALDEAGAVLVAVAVNDERAQDYSADVPGLKALGRAFPRGVAMRREVKGATVTVSVEPWYVRLNWWGILAGVVLSVPAAILFSIDTQSSTEGGVSTQLTWGLLAGLFLGGVGAAMRVVAHNRYRMLDGIGKLVGLLGWATSYLAAVAFAAQRALLPVDSPLLGASIMILFIGGIATAALTGWLSLRSDRE